MKKTYILLALALLMLCSKAFAQKNIVSIVPVSEFTQQLFSLGISYERLLHKNGKWGIKIPVYQALTNSGMFIDVSTNYKFTLQTSPGIYFYPFGQRSFTWGVGISYVHIISRFDVINYNNGPLSYRVIVTTQALTLNNSFRFDINKRFCIAADLDLGHTLSENTNQLDLGRKNKGINYLLSHYSMGIGVKF